MFNDRLISETKYAESYKSQQNVHNRIHSDNEPSSNPVTNHSQGNGHSWASDQSDDSHTMSRDVPVVKYSKNTSPDRSIKSNDLKKFAENVSLSSNAVPHAEPSRIVSFYLFMTIIVFYK